MAKILQCGVEGVFSLVSNGEVVEGELIGPVSAHDRVRVKVGQIGDRTVVRPVSKLGDVVSLTVPAEGILLGASPGPRRGTQKVQVELLRDHRFVEGEDQRRWLRSGYFLVGEYVRQAKYAFFVDLWKDRRLDSPGVFLYNETRERTTERLQKRRAHTVITLASSAVFGQSVRRCNANVGA